MEKRWCPNLKVINIFFKIFFFKCVEKKNDCHTLRGINLIFNNFLVESLT